MLINDSYLSMLGASRSYPQRMAQGWSSKVTNRTPPRRRSRRSRWTRCPTAASKSRTTRPRRRAAPRWRRKPTNGRPTMQRPQWVTDDHWWKTGRFPSQCAWVRQMWSGSMATDIRPFLEPRRFSCLSLCLASRWYWARHDEVQCKPWLLAQGPFGWRKFRRWRGQEECVGTLGILEREMARNQKKSKDIKRIY